jgi:hypothetical protein
LLGQYCVQLNMGPAGFYRSQKCDEHLRLSVSKHGDGGAIFVEAVYQVRSEGIRTPAELAISELLIAADVCDRVWGSQRPVVDLFDEIHSKALINKRWRGKVASAVDRD